VSEASGEGRIVRLAAQDGLLLAARVFGERAPGRQPVLCLPGLSRNSKDFLRLGQAFGLESAQPRQVVALDCRGRGLSAYDPDWTHYDPLIEAQDVLAATAALGLEKAVVVGTSRGGLLAMILGALRPGLLAGVVLNDIGPVIEGQGLARIKTYLAAARPPSDWAAAHAAVRKVHGPFFPAAGEEDIRAFAAATFVEEGGRLRPDFDPAILKPLQGLDFEQALPTLWPQFDSLAHVPVLAIRGELSDILSAATVEAMAGRHPRFERVTVPGQGHAPLLRDTATLARIEAFAQRCGAR
jgi:pimeloyl-ACP methyl ester carboxylesterase